MGSACSLCLVPDSADGGSPGGRGAQEEKDGDGVEFKSLLDEAEDEIFHSEPYVDGPPNMDTNISGEPMSPLTLAQKKWSPTTQELQSDSDDDDYHNDPYDSELAVAGSVINNSGLGPMTHGLEDNKTQNRDTGSHENSGANMTTNGAFSNRLKDSSGTFAQPDLSWLSDDDDLGLDNISELDAGEIDFSVDDDLNDPFAGLGADIPVSRNVGGDIGGESRTSNTSPLHMTEGRGKGIDMRGHGDREDAKGTNVSVNVSTRPSASELLAMKAPATADEWAESWGEEDDDWDVGISGPNEGDFDTSENSYAKNNGKAD
eukprot:CFRG2447T1